MKGEFANLGNGKRKATGDDDDNNGTSPKHMKFDNDNDQGVGDNDENNTTPPQIIQETQVEGASGERGCVVDPSTRGDANKVLLRQLPPREFKFFRDIFGIPDDDDKASEKPNNITFDCCGGLEEQIDYIRKHLMFIMAKKEDMSKWGIDPIKGIIFHGPPGSGKTLLARALANELGQLEGTAAFSFYMRSATEMYGKYVGQTESAIRSLFETARRNKPSIIFLDEIDGMAGTREESSPNAKFHNGVVTQLLACMDQVVRGEVIVIGATNRLESIDPAFKRPGRFDKTIAFHLPKAIDREKILKIHSSKWQNKPCDQDYQEVAKITVGFTGADLEHLCREVFMVALFRQFPEGSKPEECNIDLLTIEMIDWLTAISKMVRSNSNVFGHIAYTGEVANPEIRLLTTGLEEEISKELEPFVRDMSPSEAKVGTGIKSFLLWSSNPNTVEAINAYVIPSYISSRDSSNTISYKLDNEILTPRNRIKEFMNKIFETKKSSILYIPDLDEVIIHATRHHLDRALAKELGTIRGKNILLLATTSHEISNFPEAFEQLFHGDRTLKIRTMKSCECEKFLKPVFTSEFYKNEQNCLNSTCAPATTISKSENVEFETKLNELLTVAVDLSEGDEIPNILNLKAELIQSAKVKQTHNQHVEGYQKILDHHSGRKSTRINDGSPTNMYI